MKTKDNIETDGTLTVDGASTLAGNVAMAGTVAVTGASTLTGDVTMSDDAAVTGEMAAGGVRVGAVASASNDYAFFYADGTNRPKTNSLQLYDYGTNAFRTVYLYSGVLKAT